MNVDDLLAYDAETQADFEACSPAVVQFGSGAEIACAGGNLRETDLRFVPGGMLGEFTLVFRVRKARLPDGPPDLGGTFRWKRSTDTDWRGEAMIARVSDPRAGVAYTVFGKLPDS